MIQANCGNDLCESHFLLSAQQLKDIKKVIQSNKKNKNDITKM
jgi:hypothetical protein